MTNRELLNLPPPLLSEPDKQRLFLLRIQSTSRPCPACHKSVNVFDAAGINVDHYDFGSTPRQFRCPHCQAVREQVVPAFSIGPLWQWRLQGDWLPEQRARARDHEAPPGPAGRIPLPIGPTNGQGCRASGSPGRGHDHGFPCWCGDGRSLGAALSRYGRNHHGRLR